MVEIVVPLPGPNRTFMRTAPTDEGGGGPRHPVLGERPGNGYVRQRSASGCVVVVELARAALGEAAADHVADRQQSDVEPRVLCAEVVRDLRREKDTDD